jgi:hypothetical protein
MSPLTFDKRMIAGSFSAYMPPPNSHACMISDIGRIYDIDDAS